MDTNLMLLAMAFGSVGLGLFMYGRKAERVPHLAAGLALMIAPMLIHDAFTMLAVGSLVAAAPFVIGRR